MNIYILQCIKPNKCFSTPNPAHSLVYLLPPSPPFQRMGLCYPRDHFKMTPPLKKSTYLKKPATRSYRVKYVLLLFSAQGTAKIELVDSRLEERQVGKVGRYVFHIQFACSRINLSYLGRGCLNNRPTSYASRKEN